MTSTISPDKLLREMSDLWTSMAKQSEGDTSAGVLRACSMTLMVIAGPSDDAQELGETLAALMPEHPSRAIIIRLQPSAGRSLDARVFAQCWMPFGHREQICCEQIEINASQASLSDLPAVILPLAVPDLPAILWCRHAAAFQLPDFPRLAGLAQKVVIDSSQFPDAPQILKQLAERSSGGHILGDLAWTRLTRWRELVSQVFENRTYLADLPHISEVRVAHSGDVVPVEAWYVAAWLSAGVRQAGGEARVSFQSSPGCAACGLVGVELLTAAPEQRRFSVLVVEDQAVEIHAGSLVHRTVFPPDTAYALMREELTIPGRDAVFDRTLAAAAALALSSINR